MKLTSLFNDIKIIFKVHPSEKEKTYLLKLFVDIKEINGHRG